MTVEIHGSAQDVSTAEAAIAKIQAGRQPEVHNQPEPDWCA
jgi:hypothetical protein